MRDLPSYIDACDLEAGSRFKHAGQSFTVSTAREVLRVEEFSERYEMEITTETGEEFRFSTYVQLEEIST